MDFTEDQIEAIERLAGVNYTVDQIAMYLDVPPGDLQEQFDDEDSDFRFHYDRGKLIAQAKIDMQTQGSAEKGNLTAAQTLEKIRQSRHFENMRDKMLYGH